MAFKPHTHHFFLLFKGKESPDATKWLRLFTYQLGKRPDSQPIPSAQWLYMFDSHLRDTESTLGSSSGRTASTPRNCSFAEVISHDYARELSPACKSSGIAIIHTRFEVYVDLLDWVEPLRELFDTQRCLREIY